MRVCRPRTSECLFELVANCGPGCQTLTKERTHSRCRWWRTRSECPRVFLSCGSRIPDTWCSSQWSWVIRAEPSRSVWQAPKFLEKEYKAFKTCSPLTWPVSSLTDINVPATLCTSSRRSRKGLETWNRALRDLNVSKVRKHTCDRLAVLYRSCRCRLEFERSREF